MKIALVGATGLVGSVMLKVLEERKMNIDEIIPVATEKSIGKIVHFNGKEFPVVTVSEAISRKPQFALFSAGAAASLEYAPKFAEIGCRVVDNSSAWRMNPDIKLIVPEINAEILTVKDTIIANPNCSTIQMVMALAPLHKEFGLKRVVVSTYQSVTGTGIRAVRQMENERAGIDSEKVYPYTIDRNCFPHCDVFTDNGYTKEEMKLINETRKILNIPNLPVTSTAVRVPVTGGHSEAVNAEFFKKPEIDKVHTLLSNFPGIVVIDDISKSLYPYPLMANGRDDVFVGRIREDFSQTNTINMWIVSDNLRKGAATNAVQILEYLIANLL